MALTHLDNASAPTLRERFAMLNFLRRSKSEHEVRLRVETDREDDGRWLAEFIDLPGVMAYGQSEEEAVSRAAALALRVLAERIESGEKVLPHMPLSVSLVAV